MNLRARILSWLALATIVVFFTTCTEDPNFLGFRVQNPRFSVQYVELPVETSNLLFDSIPTYNSYLSSSDNILLLGKYQDAELGSVVASPFFQYQPGLTALEKIVEGAIYDSITLSLAYNFYVYGSGSSSMQRVYVHELTGDLNFDSAFYNTSHIDYNPTPLAQEDFIINYALLDELYKNSSDTTLTLNIKLDDDIGLRIWDAAITGGEEYTDDEKFVEIFKGLVVIPDQMDKIIGIKAEDPSAVIVHYHTDDDTLSLNFQIQASNFTRIESDRSGTIIENIDNPTDLRFIQSGAGVVTKINFQSFLDFTDTIPNLELNSAELVIDPIQPFALRPPQEIWLQALTINDKPTLPSDEEDSIARREYGFSVLEHHADTYRLSGRYFIGKDYPIASLANVLQILYSDGDRADYSGYLTIFLQHLYEAPDDKKLLNFAIRPSEFEFGKSVNRAIFNKNNIRLKIYYTVPNLNNIE